MSEQNESSLSSAAQSFLDEARASTNPVISRTMWGIALTWFAVDAALEASGAFSKNPLFIGPFVVVPVSAFAVAFAVSPRVRAWTFAFDTRTLVTAQAVRTAGMSFLAVYAVGQLNGKFALWAGLLDCAVGFSAPFAGRYLTPLRTTLQRRFLIAWMVPGIADFLVAVFLARMARTADPASMAALSKAPLSMITTFFVPLALIDYFMIGAHLWQHRTRVTEPRRAGTGDQ